jgi:hypothetical protein
MLRSDFESSGAVFYHDAPILTRAKVHETYAAWRNGETIQSKVTAVGFIALTPEEQYLFGRREMISPNYTSLQDTGSLSRSFNRVRGLLVETVLHDASPERGDLGGDMRLRAYGGYYRERDNLAPWHSDDRSESVVRYVVSHGVAPTRGTIGEVSRSDIVPDGRDRGDLINQDLVAVGGQLEPTEYAAGTVLRFGPDIHAGGLGRGARMLHQATVTVPQ